MSSGVSFLAVVRYGVFCYRPEAIVYTPKTTERVILAPVSTLRPVRLNTLWGDKDPAKFLSLHIERVWIIQPGQSPRSFEPHKSFCKFARLKGKMSLGDKPISTEDDALFYVGGMDVNAQVTIDFSLRYDLQTTEVSGWTVAHGVDVPNSVNQPLDHVQLEYLIRFNL